MRNDLLDMGLGLSYSCIIFVGNRVFLRKSFAGATRLGEKPGFEES